jgi:branched-subunit amino acid transport protein
MLLLVMLSRRTLPGWFAEWLELVPAVILSAPTLFAQYDPGIFALGKIALLTALPTLLCACLIRSLAGTVIVGMFCYWGLKLMM